jgi:hypothetical protein
MIAIGSPSQPPPEAAGKGNKRPRRHAYKGRP